MNAFLAVRVQREYAIGIDHGTLSPVRTRVLGLVVGFAIHGAEGGVLWSLVGYFLGKAIQSTLWTVEKNYGP